MKSLNLIASLAFTFYLVASTPASAEHAAVTPTGGRGAYTPTGSQANPALNKGNYGGHGGGGYIYQQGRYEPRQYNLNQPYNVQRESYVDRHYGNQWNNNYNKNWNNNNYNRNWNNNYNRNWNNNLYRNNLNYWDNSGGGYGYSGNYGYGTYSGSPDATSGTENMTQGEEALYQYNKPSSGDRGNPVFYNNSVGNDNTD